MEDQTKLAQMFIDSLPHARALGMTVRQVSAGQAEMQMPYDERLIGNPKTGVIHGGAVSTLMDTCCGAAAMMHPDAKGATATIDLRIDYMRAATPGQTIVARATCYHMTRSVAFVRATALDDNTDVPVACATGSFTLGGS